MPSYEFLVTKSLIGTFTMEADNEQAAHELVRDYAKKVILVNNVSPWESEIVKENLVDITPAMEQCPEHEGAFDCTSFCRTCGGQQEYAIGA
jgi:hypothetical protein